MCLLSNLSLLIGQSYSNLLGSVLNLVSISTNEQGRSLSHRFKVVASPAACVPSLGWGLHGQTLSCAVKVEGERIELGSTGMQTLATLSWSSLIWLWVGDIDGLELGMGRTGVTMWV